MENDVVAMFRRYKLMNVKDGPVPIEASEGLEPLFKAYLDKNKSTIYQSTLALFLRLDSRNLKKINKRETINYQALMFLKDYMKSNAYLVGKADWSEIIALEACKFAIGQEHNAWIETICSEFLVDRLTVDSKVNLLNNAIRESKYLSAAYFALYAKIVKSVKIEDICVPLIIQSKFNVVEALMQEDRYVATVIVRYLDSCIDNIGPLFEMAEMIPNPALSVLTNKVISRLAKKWARDYEVPVENCPRINHQANMTAFKYLFRRKYIDRNKIDRRTWETMILLAVDPRDKKLVSELIYDLTMEEQYQEAKYWARLFNFHESQWPRALINNRSTPNKPLAEQNDSFELFSWTDEAPKPPPPTFEISDEKIHLIETQESFERVVNLLHNRATTIAFDSEWRPLLGLLNETKETAALLQIAFLDEVYVIDALMLRNSTCWPDLVDNILNNPCILKIGFATRNDVKSLSALLPNLQVAPQNMLDYDFFNNWITQTLKLNLPDMPTGLKGLARCAYVVLGKTLAKDEQYTNWEVRPLDQDKIRYAAIDAHVLMKIHQAVDEWCAGKNVEYKSLLCTFIRGSKRGPSAIKWSPSQKEFDNVSFPSIAFRDFKALFDPSLASLARMFRTLGSDVVIPTFQSVDAIRAVLEREKRVFISYGPAYDAIKQQANPGWCFPVNDNAPIAEKMMSIIVRYKIILTDDFICTRCIRCNCSQLIQATRQTLTNWRQGNFRLRDKITIAYENMPTDEPEVDTFYVCDDCGDLLWKGVHYREVRAWIKTMVHQGFDETQKVNHGRNPRPSTSKPGSLHQKKREKY